MTAVRERRVPRSAHRRCQRPRRPRSCPAAKVRRKRARASAKRRNEREITIIKSVKYVHINNILRCGVRITARAVPLPARRPPRDTLFTRQRKRVVLVLIACGAEAVAVRLRTKHELRVLNLRRLHASASVSARRHSRPALARRHRRVRDLAYETIVGTKVGYTVRTNFFWVALKILEKWVYALVVDRDLPFSTFVSVDNVRA